MFKTIINFIIKISSYIYYYLYNWYYNKNHNDILAFPNNYNFDDSRYDILNTISISDPLVTAVSDFIDKYNFKNKTIIISLSGGVDSMVLVSILWKLSKKKDFNIVAATLDYSLRKESKYEANFTKKFCEKYGIKFNLKTITEFSRKTGNNSRNEFEDHSKFVRYDLYRELIKTFNSNGIYVAHHYDDITENVFTNIMKGGNILDLSVMHENNIVNEVNIFRPFLNFPKRIIYDFAHKYNIPYFKDTTPTWSKRGLMRNKLFVLLDNMFGFNFRKNLNDLGERSYEIGNLIKTSILKPYLDTVIISKYGACLKIIDNSEIFWRLILVELFHKMSTNSPSKKSLDICISMILEKKNIVYPIKKGYFLAIAIDNIYIIKDYFSSLSNNNISFDIDKNTIFNDIKKITLMDIINGKIEYFLPEMNKDLELLKINKNNIIKKLSISRNIPSQIIKYFNLPSYITNIDNSDLIEKNNTWNKISINYNL